MRVSINHSIEVSDVPNHVADQLDKKVDLDALKDLYNDVRKNLCSGASINVINYSVEQASNLRQHLHELDLALQDCTTILNGYVEILQQLETEPAEATTDDPEEQKEQDEIE